MEKSLRVAYGEALVELGGENENIVVLDADLAHATMTSMFAEKYPDRFFNFGIAESNMVCSAAGFAHSGFTPFVSTFALFGAGRAFEKFGLLCKRGCKICFFPFRVVCRRGRRQPSGN